MLSVSFANVTKRFDGTVAVNDLTLEIKEGELFFLLGPSGCGKTTCLRMVAGFYQPDGGTLRFGDKVMNNVPPHRRNTGMVFQNYALWPHLTARGNVEYGLRVRKMPKAERIAQADAALEMVRLGGYGDRYPNQLSGGQQQRVALARALVIRPDVLLLDEPLSNLDAQLRLEMRREIKRLHEQTGITAVYVTHDQDEALSIADRIAILNEGVLQQVGAPRELYRLPTTRFVARFIGETNFLPGTVQRSDGAGVMVATPVGELTGARRDGVSFAAGQSVWCSIRPESWRVTKGDWPSLNTLSARLESVMYLGETEQYQARLTGGNGEGTEEWRALKVSVVNPGTDAPRPGDTLCLHCAPADVVVLDQ